MPLLAKARHPGGGHDPAPPGRRDGPAPSFSLALASCDVRHTRPGSLLTRSQIALAAQTRAELESDLALPHDARAIARRHNVSAATLNNYFLGLYGSTVASYLRQRRVEQACVLLGQGQPVTAAEYRRAARLEQSTELPGKAREGAAC